ncbi:MAG: lipoprotein LpqH [Mycolicibacterium sp.]|nr:lipoprotein LpqH [Mycolicibacterium sp.]
MSEMSKRGWVLPVVAGIGLLLVVTLAIGLCQHLSRPDTAAQTVQPVSTTAPPPGLQPADISSDDGLAQPVRISATVDGTPVDLAGTVSYCDKRGEVVDIQATGPLGGGSRGGAVIVRIAADTTTTTVLGRSDGELVARETPTVVQNGSDYEISGELYRMSQKGWGDEAHPFTVTASCTTAEPVRTTTLAQPVAMAATLDGTPVDLRNTVPYCSRSKDDYSFSIVATRTQSAPSDHPSLSAVINRTTLKVSHGGIRGASGGRSFRGDGPATGENWKMNVTQDGTVYRITGTDEVSGGSVEIVADCAGI